jgi:hypothetical protein
MNDEQRLQLWSIVICSLIGVIVGFLVAGLGGYFGHHHCRNCGLFHAGHP